ERLHLGAGLARWLVILTVIVLLLIGGFAWLTYPSLEETRSLSVNCRPSFEQSCGLFEIQQQRTTAWFDNVKDLVQLLVVSLLIPLLATLIGYLFGHRVDQAPDRVETV
ncbi:MAG TPA: hypothetical protein VN817_01330, partial [Solirubrobacteraceae bacterium]|nr:hypothetical protein [Solirubrobacteraceae bacterium]